MDPPLLIRLPLPPLLEIQSGIATTTALTSTGTAAASLTSVSGSGAPRPLPVIVGEAVCYTTTATTAAAGDVDGCLTVTDSGTAARRSCCSLVPPPSRCRSVDECKGGLVGKLFSQQPAEPAVSAPNTSAPTAATAAG